MQPEQLAGCAVVLTVTVLTLRWMFRVDKGGEVSESRTSSSGVDNEPPVNSEHVHLVKTVFPHLESSAIAYDLQKTKNVDATIENALRGQPLPLPPRNSSLYARFPLSAGAGASSHSGETTPSHEVTSNVSSGSSASSLASNEHRSLIETYNLSSRISSSDNSSSSTGNEEVRNRSKLPSSKKEREELFRKRKEEMILAARKRMEGKIKGEKQDKN